MDPDTEVRAGVEGAGGVGGVGDGEIEGEEGAG